MTKGFFMIVTFLNVSAAFMWVSVGAQASLPPPAQPLVITAADIQHMLKVNSRDTSLGSIAAGKHVVDVWLDQREASTGNRSNGTMHSELTEVYVVQRGNATLKAGGSIPKPVLNLELPKNVAPGGAMFVTPNYSGPVEGGGTWELGPGDIVVLPPGAVHHWSAVPKEMRYIIVRIDPEHKQKAGFVQPLMKR